MRAYHFVGETLRDGRPVPADGEWLVHEGPFSMCESGLHASEHPFDALQYAPGSILCFVDIESEPAVSFQRGEDKVCGNRRRILARIEAEPLLMEFTRWCALEVIHLWDDPDVVVNYLKTGDPRLSWAVAAARAAVTAAEVVLATEEGSKQRAKFAEMVHVAFGER